MPLHLKTHSHVLNHFVYLGKNLKTTALLSYLITYGLYYLTNLVSVS